MKKKIAAIMAVTMVATSSIVAKAEENITMTEEDGKVLISGSGVLNKEEFHNFLKSIKNEVKSIEIQDELILPEDSSELFSASKIENIRNTDIILNKNIDTSRVESFFAMFKNLKKANPDVSNWDTSNARSMQWMFLGASSFNPDVSNWNVSKVRNMGAMFAASGVEDIDVSKWDVSNVTNMNDMFNRTLLSELDVSNWDVSKVESFQDMFTLTRIKELDLSNWKMDNARNVSNFLYGLYNDVTGEPPMMGKVILPSIEANTNFPTFYLSKKPIDLTAPKKVFLDYGTKMFFAGAAYGIYDGEEVLPNSTFARRNMPDFKQGYPKEFYSQLEDKSYTVKRVRCTHKDDLVFTLSQEVTQEEYRDILEEMPDGIQWKVETEIDTSVLGKDKVSKLNIKFPLGGVANLKIRYSVVEPGQLIFKKISLCKGDSVPEDIYLKHILNLPEGAKVEPLEKITTDEVKTGNVKVRVVYKDGSKKVVEIPYEVKKKTSPGGSGGGSSSNTTIGGVKTIIGKDRHETSLEAAKHVKSDVLVIANGYNFPDALSAQNIVNRYNAKFVLIDNKTDIDRVLRITNPKKVFVVGGEKTISPTIFKKFRKKIEGTYRVSGLDRYRTNEYTLRIGNFEKHAVADGRNFPDALASAPLNKANKLGLLLLDGSKEHKIDKEVVYTYGGENSIKKTRGKRLAGEDRYLTNILINNELKNTKNSVIVNGEEYSDALSAQNLLSNNDTSIVLGNKLTKKQIEDLKKKNRIFILGGSLGLDTSIFN